MAQPVRFDALRTSATRLLRVIVPLGALVLLSTVFLVSRSIDPERAVELSNIDLTELTREPRIGAARFAGVTQENTALVIDADTVRARTDIQSAGPLHLNLSAPHGVLQFPSGREVSFAAAQGELDQAGDLLAMEGAVVLETSDGYRVQMPRLTSALQATQITGSGGVTGLAPAGEITSESVELTARPGDIGGYLLAFNGNVRLIYWPEE